MDEQYQPCVGCEYCCLKIPCFAALFHRRNLLMDPKDIVAKLKTLSNIKSVSHKSNQKIQIFNQPIFWDGHKIEVEFTDGKRWLFYGPDFNNKWYICYSRTKGTWTDKTSGVSPQALIKTAEKYEYQGKDPTSEFARSSRLKVLTGNDWYESKIDRGIKGVRGDISQYMHNREQEEKLQEALRKGYPTQKIRLLRWFFYDQPDSAMRKVLVEVAQKEVAKERQEIRRERKRRDGTPRVLGGRLNCQIIYPSGRKYFGRVHVVSDIAVIEPDKPDTAAWVLNREDVEFDKIIDLRKLTYTRVIHNEVGINFLRQIIRS